MSAQFGRKFSLLVQRPGTKGNNPSAYIPESTLDLSELHCVFRTQNQDDEGPSNCTVRLFNMSDDTVQTIKKFGYTRVILQAGYEGNFGVIFDGTIKQFRTGRMNATDSYLDILAADGDLAYNYGISNATIAAGQPRSAITAALVKDFTKYGVDLSSDLSETGGTLPRGKVLWGMTRSLMRDHVATAGCTWSIQNGKINIIPLDSYLPGQAVVLSVQTGLVGIPEQTQDGVKVRALLNPRIVIGGLIQIDNKLVNQITQQDPNSAPVPFNQWAGLQYPAKVTTDGFYRVYVAEYSGDTRGNEWYVEITALAIDNSTNKVINNG